METYRLINKELSINNQELRNVVCKLKQEITYLNRLIFDQREEFICIKASIAKTIEKKYKETMAFIYPDKQFPDQKQIDIKSLRRSCSNATAADPINNRSHSPPVSSSAEVDVSTQSKTNISEERPYRRSIPSVIIEQSSRLSRSPVKSSESRSNDRNARKSSDFKSSRKSTGGMDDFDESELSQTLMSSNISLNTINEEKCGGLDDVPSETISDATINCMLDAPCSTPFNFLKQSNGTTIRVKECRVKIKKLSEEQLSNPSFFEKSCPHPSQSRFTKSSFKRKKEQIEACHTGYKDSQAGNLTRTRSFNDTLVKSEINSCTPEKIKTKKVKTRLKGKENIDTDSEVPYSDEEKSTRSRRLRQKQPVSLKEPSSKIKLRNCTNAKF